MLADLHIHGCITYPRKVLPHDRLHDTRHLLHRRFIPLLAGDHARRMAINHPVQSMAQYITKVAMNELFRQGSLLVNQIHDSLHDYVPEDGDRALQKKEMSSIMESVMREYLPRVGNAPVDVKISKHWSGE